MTVKKLESILKNVAEVEKVLLNELSPGREHGTGSASASRAARCKRLIRTLHQCSMDLVELDRRRMFEQMLKTRLEKDLKSNKMLGQNVSTYTSMDSSRKFDITTLPGRIEGHKNVLSFTFNPYLICTHLPKVGT